LIQNKKNIDDYVDTAWIISIVRGFLISFLLFIFSPFISMFFNSPDFRNLIELISLVPLIRGFINTSVVIFQKDLNFHKEFWFKLSVFFIDALVAISVTYLSRNPIGLIWGFVAGAIFELVFSFIFANPMPRFKYEKAKFKFVIAKGKWVTGSG